MLIPQKSRTVESMFIVDVWGRP